MKKHSLHPKSLAEPSQVSNKNCSKDLGALSVAGCFRFDDRLLSSIFKNKKIGEAISYRSFWCSSQEFSRARWTRSKEQLYFMNVDH